jgi:hypothetical protein
MTIPVAQAGAAQSHLFSTLPTLITLEGNATNAPITQWEWTMLGVPDGSTADVGTNGNFVDGVATTQNPQFTCDEVGGYTLQLRAKNATGWSVPEFDREGAQTGVFITTEKLALKIPGPQLLRYDIPLNETLATVEAVLATHATRHETGGADEITGGGGGIAPPADLFDGGRLTYFGGRWLVGLKDDLNNSVIGTEWTQSSGPGAPTLSEDGSKFRIAVATTAVPGFIKQPVPPILSFDIRAYVSMTWPDNLSKIWIGLTGPWNGGATRIVRALIQQDGAGDIQVGLEDSDGMTLVNLGAAASTSRWIRLVFTLSSFVAYYADGELGWESPPADNDWICAGLRWTDNAYFVPNSVELGAQNEAGGSIEGADFRTWRCVFT